MCEWYSFTSPFWVFILTYSLSFSRFPITQCTLYFSKAVSILYYNFVSSVSSLNDTVRTPSFTSFPRIFGELVSYIVRFYAVCILF